MRADELRELPIEELGIRLEETKEELFNLRFQLATGQLENYKQMAFVKQSVARILTVIRERELGIEPQPEVLEARKRTREERVRKAEEETEAEKETEEETEEETEAEEPDEAARQEQSEEAG